MEDGVSAKPQGAAAKLPLVPSVLSLAPLPLVAATRLLAVASVATLTVRRPLLQAVDGSLPAAAVHPQMAPVVSVSRSPAPLLQRVARAMASIGLVPLGALSDRLATDFQ